MEPQQIMRVIDTMNAAERVRALRGMHQAMVLGRLVEYAFSSIRAALRHLARAKI